MYVPHNYPPSAHTGSGRIPCSLPCVACAGSKSRLQLVMDGTLFEEPPAGLRSKQAKPDTVHVTPAPGFVLFDNAGFLKAMLECKGTNNGGTARDKALRFRTLREESIRLGGVPLIAELGGLRWTRINGALGPVIRDTEGRVFTRATSNSMLEFAPLPSLVNTAPPY